MGGRIVKACASRALLAALVGAAAAGCATTPPGVDAAKASWQGAGYEEAVLQWGAPARSTTLPDGRAAHTWVSEMQSQRGYIYPSVGIFGSSGNVGVGVGVGTSAPFGSEVRRCERTLVFQDAKVVEQTWTGPDRFCETFRRRP